MTSHLTPWLDLICCPEDGGRLKPDGTSRVLCETCGKVAIFENGILSFLRDGTFLTVDDDAKKNEMKARDESAAKYDSRFSRIRNSIEIPPCIRALNPKMSDTVVELGCGTGRLTRFYAGYVAKSVLIDFSIESLKILRANLHPLTAKKCLLIHSDISKPPLRPGTFTKAASFQVFEHLPDQVTRERTIKAVERILTPSGCFVLSVYNWSKKKQADAAREHGDSSQKEGFHRTGGTPIYYYNFEWAEQKELLTSSGLSVSFIRGLQLQLRGLERLGLIAILINRLASLIPWSRGYSHLLLAKATKPPQTGLKRRLPPRLAPIDLGPQP